MIVDIPITNNIDHLQNAFNEDPLKKDGGRFDDKILRTINKNPKKNIISLANILNKFTTFYRF